MKEVKPSKKPLAIYYAIVLLVLLVINLVVMPWLAERQVQEVDYGTFMSMTEQENIGKVDIQSNQIIFTDKDNKQIYKTGLMNDPGLTENRAKLDELAQYLYQKETITGEEFMDILNRNDAENKPENP